MVPFQIHPEITRRTYCPLYHHEIPRGGETMAVIMFEGDATVYLGSTSGRTASDFRAFILAPGDKVRYKTLTGKTIIDTIEIVIS